MGSFRKDSVAKALAFCEWPCLIGVLCAISFLLWQLLSAPTMGAVSQTAAYMSQRSLPDVDSHCRQDHQQPQPEHRREQGVDFAGSQEAAQDFGWSILTCTNLDIQPSIKVSGDAVQALLIEVIKANHSF